MRRARQHHVLSHAHRRTFIYKHKSSEHYQSTGIFLSSHRSQKSSRHPPTRPFSLLLLVEPRIGLRHWHRASVATTSPACPRRSSGRTTLPRVLGAFLPLEVYACIVASLRLLSSVYPVSRGTHLISTILTLELGRIPRSRKRAGLFAAGSQSELGISQARSVYRSAHEYLALAVSRLCTHKGDCVWRKIEWLFRLLAVSPEQYVLFLRGADLRVDFEWGL
jgi:hypothetical protein